MREITITQFNFEPDIKTFVGQVMAVIDLDASGIQRVIGSPHYLDIPVTDPVSGGVIEARDNPIRWSELLSETIGYGDIDVAVEDVPAHGREHASIEPDSAATQALVALVHQH